MVPPLRDHGHKIGLTLFHLMHVFVSNVDSIPSHRRRQLFTSLTATLGSGPPGKEGGGGGAGAAADRSRFLFALVACLLTHHARSGTQPSSLADSVDADVDAGPDGGSYIPELCRFVPRDCPCFFP